MRYIITTKEPMLATSAMELIGNYTTLTFNKIDDYSAEVKCDGILSGVIGYTCVIQEI